MLGKVSYRKATLEDWGDIERVSQGVYEGQDYLPSFYNAWIIEEETERTPRFNFVAELDGNVVGFFSLLFTRDLSTFILSATRVAREVQGRGIRGDICRFAATFARGQQEAPGVPVHQVVSFADAFISEQSLERKLVAEGRLLLTLAAPFFLLDLPSLASWAKNKSFEESQLEVANDLKEVWATPTWRRLVPEGVLHVNWHPFRPRSEEDLNYILNPKTRTMVKGPDSFSILTKALRVPAGHRVGLDIFTTDLPTFLHHLEYQLYLFSSNLPDDDVPCRLFVFTPTAWIEEVLGHMGMELALGESSLVQMGGYGRKYPTTYFCTKQH